MSGRREDFLKICPFFIIGPAYEAQTHNNGQKSMAIGHLSDSNDLKKLKPDF